MSNLYGASTAFHYAAYRPKLHELILEKCLDESESFKYGLDVGCGTGRSALALARYCDRVLAIDPSGDMISQAHQHPKIKYKQMDGSLDIPREPYEIVTFAGSLFYCKTQALLDHLTENCASGGVILVYDFQLHLDGILQELDLDIPEEISDYDHDTDFSTLYTHRITEVIHEKRTVSYPISISDLSHFLLSHESIFSLYRSLDQKRPLHEFLTNKLADLPKNTVNTIPTDLYYKKYVITPL